MYDICFLKYNQWEGKNQPEGWLLIRVFEKKSLSVKCKEAYLRKSIPNNSINTLDSE